MEDVLYLRVVGIKKEIKREQAKELWEQGRVCGIFNIPNEQVFDACRDFCIEGELEQPQMNHLQQQLKKYIQSNIDYSEKIHELQQNQAVFMQQHLREVEKLEKQLKSLNSSHQKITQENSTLRNTLSQMEKKYNKLAKDHNSCENRQKKLSNQIDSLQQKLKLSDNVDNLEQNITELNQTITELNRTNGELNTTNQTLTQQLNDNNNSHKKVPIGKELEDIKGERDKLKLQISLLKQKKKEKIQYYKNQLLLEEQQSNRLFLENRTLEKRVQELLSEKDPTIRFRTDSSLTDHLNHQLLKSYFSFLLENDEDEQNNTTSYQNHSNEDWT